MPDPPYDRWVAVDGGDMAEFYRLPTGWLVRFPDLMDYVIDAAAMAVTCIPVDEDEREYSRDQYVNAILPLIGNYTGGLFLHGSAVSLQRGQAIAFIGESRRGKTTLAGAFARAGHPFLSEDTVDLASHPGGYLIRPSRPVLRLFGDSAGHLLGESVPEADGKQPLAASASLPFAASPAPAAAIFLLGPGEADQVTIDRLSETAALAQLMRHAFILDVGDKPRLRGHFQRLSDLAATVPCYALDFPRDYAHLPAVISAILHLPATARSDHAA